MALLSDMLIQMQADMERTSASSITAMRTYIATAIRFYQNNRFWFNESESVTFNTVVGTTDYAFDGVTIPTSFYKIDGVFITTVNIDPVKLEFARPVWINARILEDADVTTPETNQPTFWSFYNNTLRLYPIPDQVYSVEIMGHVVVGQPLSDSDATSPWMNYAYDLIMCHAKAELYAHRWEDPVAAATMAKAEAIWLSSLQGETADKFRSGFVEASQF